MDMLTMTNSGVSRQNCPVPCSGRADMVAPSDMMDGRVAAIRQELDKHNFINTLIMSYAVKYSSSFYGPFRDAAKSAPSFGTGSHTKWTITTKEAVKEALTDINEGADILMVKPALAYLDVISEVSKHSSLPTAAYSVSGEYAMIKAAAKMNLIDEYQRCAKLQYLSLEPERIF